MMYFGTSDCIMKSDKYSVFISCKTNDLFYNFIVLKDCSLEEALNKRLEISEKYQKDVCLFHTPASTAQISNLERFAEDSFMFLETANAPKYQHRHSGIAFEIARDKNKFAEDFQKIYEAPGGVYEICDEGEVESIKRFFEIQPPEGIEFVPINVYKNGEIVGQIMCCISKGIMQINSIGVLPKYRYGSVFIQICRYCLELAASQNCKTLTCQTERGSTNEKLFQKLGFSTTFSCTYFKVN